jgi:hypothetical protein
MAWILATDRMRKKGIENKREEVGAREKGEESRSISTSLFLFLELHQITTHCSQCRGVALSRSPDARKWSLNKFRIEDIAFVTVETK